MTRATLTLIAFTSLGLTSCLSPREGLRSAVTANSCSLSKAQVIANRARGWASFEFDTDVIGGPMYFNARKCYAQAAQASRDYLAKGPSLSVRQRAITRFHLARNLAWAGDRTGAAHWAGQAYREDQTPNAALDWNTYVRGFHAYLVHDGKELAAAHDRLVQQGGEANLINAGVLARCKKCLSEPFLVVTTDSRCSP